MNRNEIRHNARILNMQRVTGADVLEILQRLSVSIIKRVSRAAERLAALTRCAGRSRAKLITRSRLHFVPSLGIF